MAEYVKIYLCGDCAYYDWKKHKCKRGAKVDDGSSFFRDCPIGIHEEKDGDDAEGTIQKEWQRERQWMKKLRKDGNEHG